MTRFVATSAAILILTVSAAPVSFAQVGSGGASAGGARSTSTGRSSTTTAPAAQSVPQPSTEPNSQVAPSAVGLPGGGTQVPLNQGSRIGTAVPVWGTQNNSGIGGTIDESAQRSSDIDCTGTGTRSSTGSGSTSTVTANCSTGGLGTLSIMGGGSAIDVTDR